MVSQGPWPQEEPIDRSGTPVRGSESPRFGISPTEQDRSPDQPRGEQSLRSATHLHLVAPADRRASPANHSLRQPIGTWANRDPCPARQPEPCRRHPPPIRATLEHRCRREQPKCSRRESAGTPPAEPAGSSCTRSRGPHFDKGAGIGPTSWATRVRIVLSANRR